MTDWPNQLQEGGNRGLLAPYGKTPVADYNALANVGYSITATAWGTANRAVYQPVLVTRPITVTDAIITVVTQGGNLDVGIYTWDNVLRISAGATACAAAGVQVVALTDTLLDPGWYKLGFSSDSTTAAFRSTTVAVGILRVCGFEQQTSAYVLPNPAVPATYATAIAPAVALSYTATI